MYSAKIRKFRWSAKFFLLICVPDSHCAGVRAACGLWIGAVRSFFCSFSAARSTRSVCFLILLRKGRHRVRPSSPQPSLFLPPVLPSVVQCGAMACAARCDAVCSALRWPMQRAAFSAPLRGRMAVGALWLSKKHAELALISQKKSKFARHRASVGQFRATRRSLSARTSLRASCQFTT